MMASSTHIKPDSDLPFSDKLALRENVLAWISRDIGLQNFFFPPESSTKLSADEQKTYTNTVISSYLSAPTPAGNKAVQRTLVRECAASLRRATVNLRREQVTYRDTLRSCMLLEWLWDSTNTELDDATWARCSMYFDTSFIALRLVYVLLYLRTEHAQDTTSISVRVCAFRSLVDHFFKPGCPTDRNDDKHTSNFRDLLSAWHSEFSTYAKYDDFEAKISTMEEIQGPKHAADFLDAFLRETGVDDSWMLKSSQLHADMEAGMLIRRSGPKRNPKADMLSPEPIEELPEPESSEDELKPGDCEFDSEDAEQAEMDSDELELDLDELDADELDADELDADKVVKPMRAARKPRLAKRPVHGTRAKRPVHDTRAKRPVHDARARRIARRVLGNGHGKTDEGRTGSRRSKRVSGLHRIEHHDSDESERDDTADVAPLMVYDEEKTRSRKRGRPLSSRAKAPLALKTDLRRGSPRAAKSRALHTGAILDGELSDADSLTYLPRNERLRKAYVSEVASDVDDEIELPVHRNRLMKVLADADEDMRADGDSSSDA